MESSQYTVAEFGEQNANIEQNVNGNNQTGAAIGQDQTQRSEQVIQNALADDESFAFNANGFDFGNGFEDEDFDGVEDDSDVFNDSDFDGIADIFDAFFVFGDFDNDGVNDEVENSSAAAAASAAASGDSAAAAASAASSN